MKRMIWLLTALLLAVLLPVFGKAADGKTPYLSGGEIYVAAPGELPCAVEYIDGVLRKTVPPGSTLYLPISNAQRAEDLSGLRAIAEWEEGGQYADTPRIEYRKMYDASGTAAVGYRYVVALPLLDIPDADEHQVKGTVRVAARAGAGAPTQVVSFVLHRGKELVSAGNVACNVQDLLMEFDGQAGVVTLSFYDMGTFEIDTEGQGTVNVGCSAETLTDIQSSYPDAQLRFLIWNHSPIFNRAGTLTLYAEKGESLYELRGDKLSEVTGAYSEEDGAFVLTVRRLGGYVLSDRPLESRREPVAQPNPPTGGNFE